ncbi:DUF930 domain-containing protein [Roseibium sp. RKSG952]|uniref:DUF930 domain-containing protein n=1 Tax=Roseibium sp. RKSG952 TaxID=2529384 RepID=UPI0012BB8808|nr:DUF930 domain-containing protein [Roseibium sp. RKSG952]MTH99575.1 DUF930 domain-containing protein [Roseibium sp. RKSG952]
MNPGPPERQDIAGETSDRWLFSGGLIVSVLLHVILGISLAIEVEGFEPKPIEDPIIVELVPAPEEQAPEIEQAEPEPVEPEPVEPEPVEEEVAEQPEQGPKPEERQETAEDETPPPPEPAPSSEELADSAEQPQPLEGLPVLQPVDEFADEDTMPETGEEGPPETASAPAEIEDPDQLVGNGTDAAADGAADTGEAGPEVVEQEEAVTEETVPEEAVTDAEPVSDPVVEPSGDVPLAAEAEPGSQDFGTVGPIVTAAAPASKPAVRVRQRAAGQSSGNTSPPPPPGNLTTARTLFSQQMSRDSRARRAMDGIPRDQRANMLCLSELRGQLENEIPPMPPELLPTFRVPPGATVLQPREAAFRSRGMWYDITFRCEIDDRATRVLRFQYRIDGAVPRNEWLRRRFPVY